MLKNTWRKVVIVGMLVCMVAASVIVTPVVAYGGEVEITPLGNRPVNEEEQVD